MKNKANKDMILLFILIPLFLWGAFFISGRVDNTLPGYSAINKSASGCSVFYEALGELNYPVYRSMQPLNTFDNNCVNIIAQAGSFNINNEDIRNWVGNGGKLIYLSTGTSLTLIYGIPPEIHGTLKSYKYLSGLIIVSDAAYFTNSHLMSETANAYQLISELDSISFTKLYFNESYMYNAINAPSLWSYTPLEIKFIIYQLLISLAAFFYYKGKRFGKPLPLHEETERIENEYLYSVASLYNQANCWDLMLESYYKSFLRDMNCSPENWLKYWEEKYPRYLKKAQKVYEFINNPKKKYSIKEYLQTITMLDQLNQIIHKRSELYWKTM